MQRKSVHAIWLDYVRPNTDPYLDIHAKNFSEFRAAIDEIKEHGELIDYVSFDYMLEGDPNWPFPHEKNGRDCAEYMMWEPEVLHPDFLFECHSSSSRFNNEIRSFLTPLLAEWREEIAS